jgi:hypothetical protein
MRLVNKNEAVTDVLLTTRMGDCVSEADGVIVGILTQH